MLLLDNVRFCAEEQTLFEWKLLLTHGSSQNAGRKKLARSPIFTCATRLRPRTAISQPVRVRAGTASAMGRCLKRSIDVIILHHGKPARPCVFVLGGAKIADAFMMMETVLKSGAADLVLTGGLVANILLRAAGKEIGAGSMEFILKSNYGESSKRRVRYTISMPIKSACRRMWRMLRAANAAKPFRMKFRRTRRCSI